MALNADIKEIPQIENLRGISLKDIEFLPDTSGAHVVIASILDKSIVFEKTERPDFYSADVGIGIEAMGVYETSEVGKNGKPRDPFIARQSKLMVEIEKMFDLGDNAQVYFNLREGIDSESVPDYRENTSGSKIVFYVYDTSLRFVDRGGQIPDHHYWWLDKKLREVLASSGADYVAWYRPYLMESSVLVPTLEGVRRFPKLAFIDLSVDVDVDVDESDLIYYDSENMVGE